MLLKKTEWMRNKPVIFYVFTFFLSVFLMGCSREPTINAVAIHPEKSRIIYVSMKQGVYKSRDSGKTWTQMNEGLEGSQVRSLAIDPVLSSTVYAGTFAEAVFKSVDGGQRWHRANIGLKEHVSVVNSIVFHPQDPKKMFIGTTVGVYQSSNAGGEWHETVKGMESVYVVPLVASPETPITLYCGTSGGMYKSLDEGKTWIKINKGLIEGEVGTAMALGVNSILLDHQDSKRLFIGTSKGIFTSDDSGLNWRTSNKGLSKGSRFVSSLLMDPGDSRILYAGTGEGIYKSTDQGQNWMISSSGLTNVVIWSMALDPKDSSTLYAGTQGGLFKTINGGERWNLLNVLGKKREENLG